MPHIARILVPVDFTPQSQSAVESAAELASRLGAAVDVLHVWRPAQILSGFAVTPDTADSMSVQDLELQTKSYLETLEAAGIRTCGRLERGNPGPTIVEVAEREAYDLVVMGTHARTGLSRVVLGSVAEYVVRHAPCPVLTTRAPREPVSKVPVAVVPSPAP